MFKKCKNNQYISKLFYSLNPYFGLLVSRWLNIINGVDINIINIYLTSPF